MPALPRPSIRCGLLLALLAALLCAAPPAGATQREASLLGKAYPLEAEVSFPAGLFHWVDSLAETSGGKTIPSYQREFIEKFGRPGEEDSRHILRFRQARAAHLSRAHGPLEPGTGIRLTAKSAMLGVFCASPTVEAALARLEGEISDDELDGLSGALEHFRPRYEQVWGGGRVAGEFVERAQKDGAARRILGRLLQRVARFFDVDPRSVPPPRLVLVPVPDGFGTHAEAIGRQLLIEIRPGESLADEASPIVHENAHFLWRLMPRERVERLRAAALDVGPGGRRAWEILHEALPTALGQGVADRALRPGWSPEQRWYHMDDVDAYAKAIFPLVLLAMEKGGRFDEAFVRRLVAELTPR